MKRLFSFFVVAAIACAGVFANVELSEGFFMVPYGCHVQDFKFASGDNVEGETYDYGGTLKGKVDYKSFGGSSTKATFYFGSPCSFLDLGMNIAMNLNFMSKLNVESKRTKSNGHVEKDNQYSYEGNGFDLGFYIGPAVRFNLGEKHSFIVNPTCGMSFLVMSANKVTGTGITGDYNGEFFGFSFDFALDLGYRFWFVNAEGFHFGLSAGCNFIFPIFTILTYDATPKSISSPGFTKIDGSIFVGGVKPQIYLGVVFNFGDRSVEKHR